ncbi:MAG: alpha-ketoglutarate-dependent dioxygenase AlkB [Pseudomonadota bacterium]
MQEPIIPNIPGLKYIPNYISEIEEKSLMNIIDQQSWLTDLKRRVQHYGYKYDYTARVTTQDLYLGEIPDWLAHLSRKLFDDNIFRLYPDQVIINEYLPGQGISSHIDCVPCFEETICSLSLLSPCLMDFSKNEEKTSIYLEPRSLLILSGSARFEWKHGIASRRQDSYYGNKFLRDRRVSVTFRKVKLI